MFFLDADYSIPFFPPLSPQACLSSLERPPPEGGSPCSNPKTVKMRGGSRAANRSSSWRLDAKMEPFVHELVYSGASGERECFFFFCFFFLALPWIFVIEQETFHSLCGGKPWFSSGRRSGEIPSSLPLCSAHSSKVPHSRLSWAAVYPTYDLGPDSGTLIIKCEEHCDIGSHLLLYVSRFETFLSKTDQIVMGIDSCDCAQHTSLPCFWVNFPDLLRY